MTTTLENLTTDAPSVTQRRIFLFWLPLAASWLLMGLEAPFVNAMLSRLPEDVRMIAAFGVVASVSITIESPVIMLLATATALARAPQHYRRLRQFTVHLMLLTTALHLLLGWTPLFDLVIRNVMGLPESLVEPVRWGMRIMIFWSAAIAWRRFRQGIMIRYGLTRMVGQGTIIRLAASVGVALLLASWGGVSGVAVGGFALSAGVIIEAFYAHWVSRAVVEEKFGAPAEQHSVPDLSYGELVKFHAPLATSSLLFLLAQPMVSAALSRLPNPELMLAAWPLTSGLLFITRAPALALPEVIIALSDQPESAKPLRQFCLMVGGGAALVLGALSFTPLAQVYFSGFLGARTDLATLAIIGAQVGVVLPLIMGWQSWLRGLLTANRATTPMTWAMATNLATMAGVLLIGVWWRAPGVELASVALNLAMGAETLFLWGAVWRKGAMRPVLKASPEA